jgi:hypothetical protein
LILPEGVVDDEVVDPVGAGLGLLGAAEDY